MPNRLIELMENLPLSRVVLVGDLMLDRYIFGKTGRISPEAPIPVLHYQREESRLGGAGFVLANLATLGAKVRVVGTVGNDAAGAEIRRRVVAYNADDSGLFQVDNRPTVTKVRLLGSSQERTPQQLIRLDIEDGDAIDGPTAEKLLAKLAVALEDAQALCLEDYNKGVLTPQVCRAAIQMARARGIPVLVDPPILADYSKYAGATAIKLNRPEAEHAAGCPVRSSEDYRPAAERLLEKLDLEAAIITLNDQGCYLATRDGQRSWLRGRQRQVADATGCGDVVLATLCMTRLAGASWPEAVMLANIAGGLEAERLGCVPVAPQEILQDLLRELHQNLGKQRSLEHLLAELARHRANGRKIVFTNGCFDLIHLGHVKYFQFAKAQGDLLVVGINTDASIRRLKGPKRPIINEQDRLSVLEELESIDYLIKFDEDTPLQLIEQIRPDVLVKGADYTKDKVVGANEVESWGGRVALAPLLDGHSTSAVIQRILDAYR